MTSSVMILIWVGIVLLTLGFIYSWRRGHVSGALSSVGNIGWARLFRNILVIALVLGLGSCVGMCTLADYRKAEYYANARNTPATGNASAQEPDRRVVQAPDCPTPCKMKVLEVRDLFTEGQAIWILPPLWSRDKAIKYEGQGHLVLEGGNIHAGTWEFWSVDPKKVVIIRALIVR